MREILLARQAFRRVVFVDGPCEHHSGQEARHGSEELRRFAERHDGIHYLGDGPGVVIDHTLVCGIAGWHSLPHRGDLPAARAEPARPIMRPVRR